MSIETNNEVSGQILESLLRKENNLPFVRLIRGGRADVFFQIASFVAREEVGQFAAWELHRARSASILVLKTAPQGSSEAVAAKALAGDPFRLASCRSRGLARAVNHAGSRETHMNRIDVEGGCLCGAIRYRISGNVLGSGKLPLPRLPVRLRWGSGLRHRCAEEIDRDAARRAGPLREHGGERCPRTRQFCPSCGTPLFAENSKYPQVVSVKVGSLDDSTFFKPTAQLWTGSAPPWHEIDPEVPAFNKGPESA